MSDRVLSTPIAMESITTMKQIINGPLVEQIMALRQEGNTLSDPNVWDGRLAQEFRFSWVEMNKTLTTAIDQLEELRFSVQKINDQVMRAGGN